MDVMKNVIPVGEHVTSYHDDRLFIFFSLLSFT
jgi:hypothetical protein